MKKKAAAAGGGGLSVQFFYVLLGFFRRARTQVLISRTRRHNFCLFLSHHPPHTHTLLFALTALRASPCFRPCGGHITPPACFPSALGRPGPLPPPTPAQRISARWPSSWAAQATAAAAKCRIWTPAHVVYALCARTHNNTWHPQNTHAHQRGTRMKRACQLLSPPLYIDDADGTRARALASIDPATLTHSLAPPSAALCRRV